VSEFPERYPMAESQPAQIDCRNERCKYHVGGRCTNTAPAITLNDPQEMRDGKPTYVCWSKREEKEVDKRQAEVFGLTWLLRKRDEFLALIGAPDGSEIAEVKKVAVAKSAPHVNFRIVVQPPSGDQKECYMHISSEWDSVGASIKLAWSDGWR
jgi:hypothetical protein